MSFSSTLIQLVEYEFVKFLKDALFIFCAIIH